MPSNVPPPPPSFSRPTSFVCLNRNLAWVRHPWRVGAAAAQVSRLCTVKTKCNNPQLRQQTTHRRDSADKLFVFSNPGPLCLMHEHVALDRTNSWIDELDDTELWVIADFLEAIVGVPVRNTAKTSNIENCASFRYICRQEGLKKKRKRHLSSPPGQKEKQDPRGGIFVRIKNKQT